MSNRERRKDISVSERIDEFRFRGKLITNGETQFREWTGHYHIGNVFVGKFLTGNESVYSFGQRGSSYGIKPGTVTIIRSPEYRILFIPNEETIKLGYVQIKDGGNEQGSIPLKPFDEKLDTDGVLKRLKAGTQLGIYPNVRSGDFKVIWCWIVSVDNISIQKHMVHPDDDNPIIEVLRLKQFKPVRVEVVGTVKNHNQEFTVHGSDGRDGHGFVNTDDGFPQLTDLGGIEIKYHPWIETIGEKIRELIEK